MKFIFSALLMAACVGGFSQQIRITVFAQNKTITVSPDEDNTDKLLKLQTPVTPSEAALTARVNYEEMDKGWKRNFIIYNDEDSEISRLVFVKENTYSVLLKN